MRHEFIAQREESLLLVIDVQEALRTAIDGLSAVVHRINQLTAAARLADVPVVVTEHYRKGLGPTIPEIMAGLANATFFPKEFFSACLEDEFLPLLRSLHRRQIVVAGTEAHVCVLQTSLDLIRAGFQVHLVRNAVGSRFREDLQAALDLYARAGAVVTTAEIVIFQWACRANTDLFRKLLPIVK
jgi:nicotinamidase-related amidase